MQIFQAGAVAFARAQAGQSHGGRDGRRTGNAQVLVVLIGAGRDGWANAVLESATRECGAPGSLERLAGRNRAALV